MSEVNVNNLQLQHDYASSLPTELIILIFSYLPPVKLIACRPVCVRWRDIIDDLVQKDGLWKKYCYRDFKSTYDLIRLKTHPNLLWFDTYRSLVLWRSLDCAKENLQEFSIAANINEEVKSFEILPNGSLGVHKKRSVEYYNVDTLLRSKRGTIPGHYLRYTENEHVIVMLTYHLQLYVIRKFLYNAVLETTVTLENVKTFILVDKSLYYVNWNNEIFASNLEESFIKSNFLVSARESVMSLGYSNDQLNVLTFQQNIYCFNGTELAVMCCLSDASNLLRQLRKFNFLNNLDWRVYFQWMYVFNHTVPETPLRDIVTIYAYGDMVFVGTNWGIMRIYYAPSTDDEFDFYTSEPIKQYNFFNFNDEALLSMCPIIQIDVLESKCGHTIFVAMPKKIVVINYSHEGTNDPITLASNQSKGARIKY